MPDPSFAALIHAAGLSCEWVRVYRGRGFWMVSHKGRELGSYCPFADSARVGPKVVKVYGAAHAAALYREFAVVKEVVR